MDSYKDLHLYDYHNKEHTQWQQFLYPEINNFIQNNSLLASVTTIYSALVVDKATLYIFIQFGLPWHYYSWISDQVPWNKLCKINNTNHICICEPIKHRFNIVKKQTRYGNCSRLLKDLLHVCPMFFSKIRKKLTNNSNNMSKIRSGFMLISWHTITTNGWCIWQFLQLLSQH